MRTRFPRDDRSLRLKRRLHPAGTVPGESDSTTKGDSMSAMSSNGRRRRPTPRRSRPGTGRCSSASSGSATSSPTGLGAHGEEALRLHPPRAGRARARHRLRLRRHDAADRRAGRARGRGLGVDAAPRFIEAARAEAAEAGVANARFEVADVQTTTFERALRHGLLALRHDVLRQPGARAAQRARARSFPAARLVMVVWRRREDNDWMYRAQTIVERIVERPEEYDEPTCGPGPFSMANADTVSGILVTPASRTSRCGAATCRSWSAATSRRRSTS